MSSTRRSVNRERPRGAADGRSIEPPILRVTLLGGFALTAADRSVDGESWRSRRAAQLVKLLALAPEHTLHREHLADALWPEHGPAAASNNLRQALHVARRQLQSLQLDPSLLLSRQGDRVRLYPSDQLRIDAEVFASAARAAQTGDDPDVYWAAIDLYAGPLLPDDLYEDWTTARREALISTYLTLLDVVARLHEARGELSRALVALRRITEVEPSDEAAHVRLMRIYARTGRRPLALRQYDQLVHALVRELDAEPEPETKRLFQDITAGDYPLYPDADDRPALPGGDLETAPADGALTNLPHALSSFVGRERDVDEVTRLVDAHRLVTLTGAGGSGKTRLALEVGWRQISDGALPVWLVELASLNDASLVAETIASVLGIQPSPRLELLATLVDRLRDRSLLLILDNCEHLIAECVAVVETLLSSCPNLHILATSRQPLRIRGEHPWLVPPLSLPEPGARLAALATNASVRLFFDRVREHRGDLSLNTRNAAAVATICRRLDGLPLALELAAARAAVLSLPQLADRLDDALGVLSGGRRGPDRQRTIRATLDWSYALLEPTEQRFLERLSLFRGGWTLEAAEAISVEDPCHTALDLLSQLVEKSLVQVDLSGEEARYRLLEPVRQYALERLESHADEAEARQRHARYFLKLVEGAEAGLSGPEQSRWLARLDREHDNLRAALEWLLVHEPGQGLRLVGHLARYWELRAYLTEGRAWMVRALECDPAPTIERARVLTGAGTLAWRAGDYDVATRFHQESLEIFQTHGDVRGIALATVNLGAQAMNLRKFDEATALYEEGLRLADQLDDDDIRAMALINLGLTTLTMEDFERAEALFSAGLAASERLQNKHYISVAVQNLGEIAHHLGDDDRALTLLRQSLELSVELEVRVTTAFCLEELAAIQANRGNHVLAARFLGGSDVVRTETSSRLPDNYRTQLYDPTVTLLREALGDDVFTAEFETGATLPLDQLVALALGVEMGPEPRRRP